MNGNWDENYEPLLDELEAIMSQHPAPEEGRLVALLWKIADYYRDDSGNPGTYSELFAVGMRMRHRMRARGEIPPRPPAASDAG